MTRRRMFWICGCVAASLMGSAAWAQQAPEAELKVVKDIEYANVDGVSLKLDLYLPPANAAAQPSGRKPPLLVWIHGGGWRYGDKADFPLRWLVQKGYAGASINYRLSDVALFPAGVHDCKGAIRWLRANAEKYGYDATRIGVSGGSAGGHLAALLGVTGDVQELEGDVAGHTDRSSRVQAVVNIFGPTDFPRLAEQGHPEFTTSLVALWLGDPISGKKGKDLARLASPIYHITRDDPPFLAIQGTKDPLVFVPQVASFHEAYEKAGLESNLQIIEGAQHNMGQVLDEERKKLVEALFERHIRRAVPDREK